MRTALWILLGMLIMFILLKLISSKKITTSNTGKYALDLIHTQQFRLVTKTNEFRELVKTKEFQNLMLSLGSDELVAISESLTS